MTIGARVFTTCSTPPSFRPPMPSRRRPKGSTNDLIPEDRLGWAREIWADGDEVAKTDAGIWMLREAGRILGLSEEAVDERVARANARLHKRARP